MSAKANTSDKEKKKPQPLLLVVGALVLVIVLLLGKGMLGGSKADAKEKKSKDKQSQEVGISLPLEEFLVNLSGGGDHYLRTNISLGMEKGLIEEKLKDHVPAMRDAILSVLGTKTQKDLGTEKGRDDLKEEIKKKVNEAIGEEEVVKVYFTSFATQ